MSHLNWTTEQVYDWVRNIGATFEPIAQRFKLMQISGEVLDALEEDDLLSDFGSSVETSILWQQIQKLQTGTIEMSIHHKRKKASSPYISHKKMKVTKPKDPVFSFCTEESAPRYSTLPTHTTDPLPKFDVNLPESIAVRSIKNIAWNLFKEKITEDADWTPQQLKSLYANLSCKSGTYIETSLGKPSGKKSRIISKVIGENLGTAPVTWKKLSNELEQAKTLKSESVDYLHANHLAHLLNKTGALGLCGPPESNITRIGDKVTKLHSDSFQFCVDETRASVYYVLQNVNSMTSSGFGTFEALDNLFDPAYDLSGLVQTILSFTEECYDFQVTAEGALGHKSTGSKCLDFFATQKADDDKLFVTDFESQLQIMWEEHAETCLKIIFHLGAAREGKQDRWTFYACCQWLWENHPFDLIQNLEHIPEVNYYKGLLEVLVRVTEGEKWFKARTKVFKRKKKANSTGFVFPPPGLTPLNKVQAGQKVLFLFDYNPLYRLLHKKVAQIFAKALKKDLKFLAQNKTSGYSLAAKWVPTVDSPYDERTLICESIARLLFPRDSLEDYKRCTEFQYNYRIRKRLRKEVLSPLREKLRIVEKLLSENRYTEVQYPQVPSLAMKKHKTTFENKDKSRFDDFLKKLEKGEVKVNVGSTQPYEILRDAIGNDKTKAILAEGQWTELVKKTKEKIHENLRNCIASVDTSGSMYEEIKTGITRLNVAISLALLIAEINEGPYHGFCLTFSDKPELVQIEGHTLKEKFEWFTRNSTDNWGYQTNLKNLFGTLLDNAEGFGLPSRVIILSDMEFSDLSTPDYIRRLKREKGNMSAANEMVVSLMWNTKDDLDLHCNIPNGKKELYYGNKRCCGGVLDIDMNAGGNASREPVENIYFEKVKNHGEYEFIVQNYSYQQTKRGEPINWRLTFRIGNLVHHEMGQCVGSSMQSNASFKFNYTGLSGTYWGEKPLECEPTEQFSDNYLEEWTTEFESVKRKFTNAGVEVPKVIFWNLGSKSAFPVAKQEPGTQLVTGFAATTLNTILQNGKIDPISGMIEALNNGVLGKIRIVNDMSDVENILRSV